MLVELVRPGLSRHRRDHGSADPQPQAEGIVRGQRTEIDALRVGQPAEQLVFAGMAEVDVVVDPGVAAHAEFHVPLAQQRRGEIVDQQIVDDLRAAAGVEHQTAAVVVDQVVIEPHVRFAVRHDRRAALVQQQAVGDQQPAAGSQAAATAGHDAGRVDSCRAAQHEAVAFAGGDLAAFDRIVLAQQSQPVARRAANRTVPQFDVVRRRYPPTVRPPALRHFGLEGQPLQDHVRRAGQVQPPADHGPPLADAPDHHRPARLAPQIRGR